MSRFLYIHTDGRDGRGAGGWRAIVAALGPAEARSLPDLAETSWMPNLVSDFDEMDVRLENDDDTLIGRLFRYASSWAPLPGEDECDHPRDAPPQCPLCPGVLT